MIKKTKKGYVKRAAISSLLVTAFAVTSVLSTPIAVMAGTGSTGAAIKYYTDFVSYEEEQEAAADLNVEIFQESVILMKNQNGSLPLTSTERKVTVFGMRSYDTVTGGTGSGAASASGGCTLTQGLREDGFSVNGKVEELYNNTTSVAAVSGTMMGGYSDTTVEANPSILANVEDSYVFYGDVAIWTIGRIGGEGADLMRSGLPTTEDKTKHILQLDDNEMAMLEYLKAQKENGTFSKIIVLINSANVMEMGTLEDDALVDAILWIGQPGANGLRGLGEILTGEVSPSGRTVDIWPANLKNDPTWQNTGKMSQLGTDPDTGAAYKNVTYRKVTGEDGKVSYVRVDEGGNFGTSSVEGGGIVEYEEGIYIGYKWYETIAADGVMNNTALGYNAKTAGSQSDVYYNRSNGVIYPYGYGLSYTTFSQTVVTTAKEIQNAINNAGNHCLDKEVAVKVKVTNTGSVAGKEVVQLYINAPYTKGGIEKAEVALAGFAKTSTLQPGESETVTVMVRIGDLASFDYDDANNNGYKGYELEAGTYKLRLQNNSHEVIQQLTLSLNAKTTQLDNDDDKTNNTPLSNGDDFDTLINIKDKTDETGKENAERGGNMTILSRADFVGTYPTAPKASDMLYGERTIQLLSTYGYLATDEKINDYTRYTSYITSDNDKTTDPWYKTKEDIPSTWTQAATTEGRTNGKTDIQLRDMIGLDYWSDEMITEGKFAGMTEKQAWEKFMNQLTYEELKTLLESGSFSTPALESIGKERETAADGPIQLSSGTFWCCEVNVGSTWNTELAYRQGVMVGNESLFLNCTGWYAPAMNIHRSAFTGRNFEYYSQDGTQSGLMAAAVVSGYQSKGGMVYVKHYVLNDEEDNRLGGANFADEQTIRENYLRAFEYSFKKGGATAIMTAHTRLGALNCYGNYRLLQTITAEEFGWKGLAITDMYLSTSKSGLILRAGSLALGSFSGNDAITGTWDATVNAVRDGASNNISYTQWYAVRMTATRVCWAQTISNSVKNGMDASAYTGKSFALTQNVSASGVSVAADLNKLGLNDVTYAVTSGSLPAGLTLNAKTGVISGTPSTVSAGSFEITLTADGWAQTKAQFNYNVGAMFTANAGEAQINTAYSATISAFDGLKLVDKASIDADGKSGYTGLSFTAENLPKGLSIDAATGAISGTPAVSGEYKVTVNAAVTYSSASMQSGGKGQPDTLAVKDTVINVPIEMTIAIKNAQGVVEATVGHGGIMSAVIENNQLVITYEDGFVDNLGNVVGANGINGTNGTNGTNGANGADGANANTGWIAVVAIIGAVLSLIALYGAFVLGKKKNK